METENIHERNNLPAENYGGVSVCDDDGGGESCSNSFMGQFKEVNDDNFDLEEKRRKNLPNYTSDEICFAGTMPMFGERKKDAKLNDLNGEDCNVNEQIPGSKDQRAKINLRERKRMHDLNTAMEGLREVMPCASGPTMRKLSKVATLSLARNYIQMLTRSIEELKMLLDEAYRCQTVGPTIARRRNASAYHPYRQYIGIRNVGVGDITNNFHSYYSSGFARCANIYGNPNRNVGACAGFGCCTESNVVPSGPRSNICTTWNSST